LAEKYSPDNSLDKHRTAPYLREHKPNQSFANYLPQL